MTHDEYFQELNFFTIPESLLENLDEILLKKNTFTTKNPKITELKYATFETSSELHNYLQNNFDFLIRSQYQLIREDLDIHKDRTDVKWIYYIDQGGENTRLIWHTPETPNNILATLNPKPKTWYKLFVDKHHSVVDVKTPRLSISVSKKV